MSSRIPTILCLCLAAMLALPAAAGASTRQLAVFEDNGRLVQSGDAVREATLRELDGLGVDVIKFQLTWAEIAPRRSTKPRGFDGRDPADYPGWGPYDSLFTAARAHGFRVMLAVGPPAPGWATRRRGDRSGVDRPSATEYGRFVEAAGERYAAADLWTLWNEPNHKGFLYPQSSSRGIPYAPHLYRSLVRAAVRGLARSGNSRDRVLFGELLPIAPSGRSPRTNLRPLVFLREFFCLDSRGQPFRGRAASARGCSRFRRISGVNGFGYHPYTRTGGPRVSDRSRDNATIGALSRVTRVLDLGRRRGRIGGGRLSIWNTEFGYQSNPPDRFQTRLSRIAGFINESEWISYRNRRVASYSQYTLFDEPLGRGTDASGSWQGGLRFVSERPKPGVYGAYRLPIFVRLLGPSAVEVWGAARPGGSGAEVQVQQRSGRGGYRDLGAPIVVSNPRGYFSARYRLSRASRRSYRFLSSGLSSRAARAAVR
jgi:hypothetical protein